MVIDADCECALIEQKESDRVYANCLPNVLEEKLVLSCYVDPKVLLSLCAINFQWGWHLDNSQANPEQVRFCWLRKLLLKPIYGKAPGHAEK